MQKYGQMPSAENAWISKLEPGKVHRWKLRVWRTFGKGTLNIGLQKTCSKSEGSILFHLDS